MGDIAGVCGVVIVNGRFSASKLLLLVYVSAWLKCYEPAAFCAALVNSQPMGFYAPAQLVQDAHRHGVDVPEVSDWRWPY